ncbi:MAG: NAD(P)/FAD-dependent oxidoreductase [Microbacterium sp.]|uniref:NAD(P)/FAD-dependent oxidoreductase n=1 Tax=Microbacterium sp. TaxID=51671 RepID=UPI001AD55A6B|nr:FAD/NAD(P)-binding oxidoreductase [Microbacterium sp.]MBN9176528.1 NAD(P)/FAD-dependent oxidoreductase [Microbacterium sp.]
MTGRIVVVGASIAGLTVAETLRQEGFAGEIVLVGDEPHLPYTRPPLSKQILMGEWEPADAAIRTAAELDGLDIQVRTGCTAIGLDVAARTVHTTDGALAYDEVVIATGTEPRRHPTLPGALMLRTMDDAVALRQRLRSARRVAVVGSGILGSEIASAARKHDADTLLIGRSGALGFGGVGTLLSKELIRLHEEHGVELALHTEIESMDASASGTSHLRLVGGGERAADLVVAMIGGSPRVAWLSGAGLDLADGVVCDVVGRAVPGVWAVGDVAAWTDPATGAPRRIEHQSYAIEQALSVALRLAHGAESPAPVPLFWSEIHGTRIQSYGWFDTTRPLADITGDDDARGRLYGSHDDDGELRGVVGWNATPRAFRAARAAIHIPAAPITAAL